MQRKANKDSSKKRGTAYLKGNVFLIVAFMAVILTSLVLRLHILPVLTVDPTLVLTGDADSPSYLRLFDMVIAKFPKMPTGIDYYSNYPWGFLPDTPPIWPYFLALIALPVSKVLSLNTQQVAGLLVVVISMAATIPIYYLAKELFNKKVALITAALALVHPFFIISSSAAIDHITADVFLVPSVFALFFIARRYFYEENLKKFAALAVLGGICVAVSIMVSLSLILVLSIMLIPVAVALFMLSKKELRPILAALGGQFGAATFILCLFALITPWFSSSLEYDRLSYFHIVAFGAIAAFGGLGYLLLRTNLKQSMYRSIIGIIIFTVIGVALFVPHIREVLLSGLYRSIGNYPLGKNTNELVSLAVKGKNWLFQYYSYFIIVTPVTTACLLVKDIRQHKISFEHLFFYAMLFVLGFYTFEALYYFSPYLSTFMVITYGLTIALGSSFVSGLIGGRLNNARPRHLGGDILAILGAFVVVVIMVLTVTNVPPRITNANLAGIANYLKTNTDASGDFYDPATKPAYSVMCYWGDGFLLQYLSQRAMVSSGNHEIGMPGIIASERFYQANSENAALSALQNLNVKYVVAGGPYEVWSGDVSKIGDAGANPDEIVRLVNQNELSPSQSDQLMATRLVSPLMSSLAARNNQPLHHFRLLFISYYDNTQLPLLLYEVVKGARVVVKGVPNAPVAVSINADFSNKRFVVWQDSGQTDANGTFSTVIPYPTSTSNAPLVIEPCRINIGGTERTLTIQEKTVIDGTTINL